MQIIINICNLKNLKRGCRLKKKKWSNYKQISFDFPPYELVWTKGGSK